MFIEGLYVFLFDNILVAKVLCRYNWYIWIYLYIIFKQMLPVILYSFTIQELICNVFEINVIFTFPFLFHKFYYNECILLPAQTIPSVMLSKSKSRLVAQKLVNYFGAWIIFFVTVSKYYQLSIISTLSIKRTV